MQKVRNEVPQALLTSKGQATIPKAVRDHLCVGPGDRIQFFLGSRGSVGVLPVRSPKQIDEALKEIRSRVKKSATLEEIELGIMKGATAKFRPKSR